MVLERPVLIEKLTKRAGDWHPLDQCGDGRQRLVPAPEDRRDCPARVVSKVSGFEAMGVEPLPIGPGGDRPNKSHGYWQYF
jgi:hypothetical protein